MQRVPDMPIRVMVADDYPAMHPAIAMVLAPWCEIVGSVTDAACVLDEARRLQPDVVVLDVRMQGTNGFDTCRRLKTTLPAVKIVMCSVGDDAGIRRSALDAGAADFVAKDCLSRELLSAIHRAVA